MFNRSTLEIVKSARKTASILVYPNNSVKVCVPKWMPSFQIDRFIEDKKAWIEKRLLANSLKPQLSPKTYTTGEPFLYLGQRYTLQVIQSAKNEVFLSENTLYVHTKLTDGFSVFKGLKKWIKTQAADILLDRLSLYKAPFENKINSVSFKYQNTRWGSCSSKGNINLNWKLIFTPLHVIDYVIVHELCHLIEMNHGPKFWKCVEQHYPSFKQSKDWLKKYESVIEFKAPKELSC